jgi:hypothetical protein
MVELGVLDEKPMGRKRLLVSPPALPVGLELGWNPPPLAPVPPMPMVDGERRDLLSLDEVEVAWGVGRKG